MKNFKIFIATFTFFVVALSVDAQQYVQTFSNDTVQADTTYFPSSSSAPGTLRPSYGIKSSISTGVVSFTFTHTDVADSLSFAGIEGSNDATNWTSAATLAATSTDGTSTIYTSTPLSWLYYRVRLSCATDDTVAITNPKLIYKEK